MLPRYKHVSFHSGPIGPHHFDGKITPLARSDPGILANVLKIHKHVRFQCCPPFQSQLQFGPIIYATVHA